MRLSYRAQQYPPDFLHVRWSQRVDRAYPWGNVRRTRLLIKMLQAAKEFGWMFEREIQAAKTAQEAKLAYDKAQAKLVDQELANLKFEKKEPSC